MDLENEQRQITAIIALLTAKADAWHEITFHSQATELDDIADKLLYLAAKLYAPTP